MLRSTRKLSQKFVPLSALLLGFTLFSAPSWADESHAAANPASLAPRPAPEKFWTDLPAITPGGPRAERGMVSLTPRNISTTELQLFNPNEPAKPVQLILDGGRWLVAPSSPDKGGHHWLSTRESNGNKVITASTAWSFPAKGDAPTKLLKQNKGGLEIVPDHLPEHGGMREGEDWTFHVRFDGKPLPGALVRFETESGTKSRVVTDGNGVAKIAFPRDIDPAAIDPKNGATRTRKGFVLASEYQQGEIKHQTAFIYFYFPDLMRERNLSAGFGFLAFGMLLALPLLRRKESSND